MIKCVFLLRRQPHLTREEFLAYWRTQHAALAKQIAGPMRMKRYIQLHPLEHPMGKMLADSRGSKVAEWDGITECWWDSFDDMSAVAGTSEELAAKVLADEQSFVDMSRSEMMFVEENIVIA
jgi:uncharacterized protein (TIGR02118 family)